MGIRVFVSMIKRRRSDEFSRVTDRSRPTASRAALYRDVRGAALSVTTG